MLKMLLLRLLNFLLQKREAKKPEPVLRAELSIGQVWSLLQTKFPEASIFLSDTVYQLATLKDIDEFLRVDQTNKMGYVPEERDCDDFSFRLMGQFSTPEWSGVALGIIWTDLHALNCFIDQNSEFWFIEPQTDNIQQRLVSWQVKNLTDLVNQITEKFKEVPNNG